MPAPRLINATEKHELFYHDIMASATRRKISDAELTAILALTIGRMIGAARPGEDKTTIQDTAVYNILQGRTEIKGLLEATGKGN